MFEAAIGTALTFILLFGYIGFKKIAGFAWVIDIGIFALCLWLFKGTYAGMMTGMIAGLLITIFLKLFRRCCGYEVLSLSRQKDQIVPRIRWKEIKP